MWCLWMNVSVKKARKKLSSVFHKNELKLKLNLKWVWFRGKNIKCDSRIYFCKF